jgi:3-oxoacyl-[acyl-carrier protein] reductase
MEEGMKLGLDGRIALITGGSKGIGKAVARSLIAEGMHICICARDSDSLEQAAAELVAMSQCKVLAVPADVESRDDIKRLVQRTVDEFGRIDLLVNNAGPGAVPGKFLSLSDEDWQRAVNVRIFGAVRMVYEVAPIMIRQGKGRIINIGGISGKEPDDWTIMMGVVAGGVVNFTRGLARTLTPQGVTVAGVAPGRTFTANYPQNIKRLAAQRGVSEDEMKQFMVSRIPLGRFIQPEEIGDVVAFLASDLALGINGTTVMVDGGELRGL